MEFDANLVPSSPPSPSFPPHPKWDSSKNVKYFEGNTLVCMIPPSSSHFALLKAAQSILKNSSIAKYYGFLPPSSFHMTVFDLLSDSNGKNWTEIHKDIFKKCQNILRSASWTTFKMEYETVREDCCMVVLKPSSPTFQICINSWRLAVQQDTSIAPHPRYYFHITWAYVLQPMSNWSLVERSELEQVRKQTNLLLENWNHLELHFPRLCVFYDMSEFLPLNCPIDFNAMAGFDPLTQQAVFIKIFGHSSSKELDYQFITWQTNDPNTHFTTIVEKEKLFLLSYSPAFGNVWMHRIYSSFNRHCISQLNWEPGWSHFVFLKGQFILYNQSSGKLKKLLFRTNEDGSVLWKEKNTWIDSPGASSIMAFDLQGKTLILLYFKHKGVAHVTDGHGFNKVFNWSIGWTHFIPLHRDTNHYIYLAYKAGTGQANVTKFSPNLLSDLNKTSLTPNLAHIIAFPMNGRMNLLLLPFPDQGSILLYRLESDYSLTLTSTLPNQLQTPLTEFVPLDLTTLIHFE